MKRLVVGLVTCISLVACKKDCPEPEPSCTTDLTKGLLAYFPFNGTFNDESGNGLHATPKNGAFLTTDYLGRGNKAAGFDGLNDYAIVPANSKLSSVAMTISFEVMVNNSNRHNAAVSMVDFDDATSTAFAIHGSPNTANKWSYTVNYPSTDCAVRNDVEPISAIRPNSPIEAGRWHNIIATFVNGAQKIYIDGVLHTSVTTPFTNLKQCSKSDLVIGGWWASDILSIDGKLDEMRLYNRVLSDCEIAKLAEVFKN